MTAACTVDIRAFGKKTPLSERFRLWLASRIIGDLPVIANVRLLVKGDEYRSVFLIKGECAYFRNEIIMYEDIRADTDDLICAVRDCGPYDPARVAKMEYVTVTEAAS